MPLPLRHLLAALLVLVGLAACATTVATPPHPLLTARSVVPVIHPADSSQQRQARQLLIRGMTHARIGDHERALEFYQQALEVAPDAPAVLSAVASAYEALDEVPTALLYAERAVRLAPENTAYRLHWIDLLERNGQNASLDEAIADAVDRFPTDPQVLRTALEHRIEQGRIDEAVPLAERLADSDPGRVPWQELLPHLSAEQHADLYEKGLLYQLEARPAATEPYVELGRLYLQTDRPTEALDVLETGRLHTNGGAEMGDLLTEARRATGTATTTATTPADMVAEVRRLMEGDAPTAAERRRARALLGEALAADPDRPEALALAGRLAYEAGDYAEAAEHLQRALQINPRDVELWKLTAEAQLASGETEGALETLGEALLLFPGSATLLDVRSRAHLALGDPEAAQADAQRAAGADVAEAEVPDEPPSRTAGVDADTPTSTAQRDARPETDQPVDDERDQIESLTVAGRAAYEAGDFPTAADRLERVLELDPDDPSLWELAVRYQLAAGDATAALETAREALFLFPRHQPLMLARARSHLALGRANVAAGYAQRVLEQSGEDVPPDLRAEALVILGEARLAKGDSPGAREAWERALQLTPDDQELRRRIEQL